METIIKTKQKISVPTGIIIIVWIASAVFAITAFILTIISSLFRIFG